MTKLAYRDLPNAKDLSPAAKREMAAYLSGKGYSRPYIAERMGVTKARVCQMLSEYAEMMGTPREALAPSFALLANAIDIAERNESPNAIIAAVNARERVVRTLSEYPAAVNGAGELALAIPPIHDGQAIAKESPTRYMMLRAGRRWGKTMLAAVVASEMLRDGQRLLYVAPQVDQTREFWRYVRLFLANGARITDNPRKATIDGQDGEIRAVSSWNGDGLRGSFADLIIMDEAQLQAENVVEEVVMPMLLDTGGRLWLTFTPPSLESLASSRAEDKTWINRYWRDRADNESWTLNVAPTADNPHIDPKHIDELREQMSDLRFRVEVLAEPLDDIPGALWRRDMLFYCADHQDAVHPRHDLMRVVIGVDPAGGKGHVGIVAVGIDYDHRLVVLEDASVSSETNSPKEWSKVISNAYRRWRADSVVVERNFGGDTTIAIMEMIDPDLHIIETTSSRGKYVRAEPIALMYERGQAYHCQPFRDLELQLTSWLPDNPNSPDRLDALVFAANELAIDGVPDMNEVYKILDGE